MSCWHNPTDKVFKLSFFKGGQKVDFRWEPNGYCEVSDEFDRLVKLEAPAVKKVKADMLPQEPAKESALPAPAPAKVEAKAEPKEEPKPEAPKPWSKVENKSVAVVPASPKKEKK
jgi:hypothetical protein